MFYLHMGGEKILYKGVETHCGKGKTETAYIFWQVF